MANAGKTTTAVAASDGGSCLNDASVWDPPRAPRRAVARPGRAGGVAATASSRSSPRAASLALTSSDRATNGGCGPARRDAVDGGEERASAGAQGRGLRARADAVPPHVPATISGDSRARRRPGAGDDGSGGRVRASWPSVARWFTRNQAREAAETVALLDAITEAVGRQGTGRGFGSRGRGARGGAGVRAALERNACRGASAPPPGGGGGDRRRRRGERQIHIETVVRADDAPGAVERGRSSVAFAAELAALRTVAVRRRRRSKF